MICCVCVGQCVSLTAGNMSDRSPSELIMEPILREIPTSQPPDGMRPSTTPSFQKQVNRSLMTDSWIIKTVWEYSLFRRKAPVSRFELNLILKNHFLNLKN